MCLACGYYNGRQVMDLEGEKKKRDQRLKEKRDRITVGGSIVPEPALQATAEVEEVEKPKEKVRAAKGAAAKRLRDESASERSTGTE